MTNEQESKFMAEMLVQLNLLRRAIDTNNTFAANQYHQRLLGMQIAAKAFGFSAGVDSIATALTNMELED